MTRDLLQEVCSIAETTMLPDGDGVNIPTLLWAEGWARTAPVIEALRAELAEPQAKPQEAPLKRSDVDFLPYDDSLRFVARVLASDAPKADREDAAQMVRDIRRSLYAGPQAQPAVAAPLTPHDEKYSELLYAVGNKHPGETRHQTALRYIRQAEASTGIEKEAAHGITTQGDKS